MGKRGREHRQAVIAGTEKPFRASPDKSKGIDLSASEKIMERIRKLKEQKGG